MQRWALGIWLPRIRSRLICLTWSHLHSRAANAAQRLLMNSSRTARLGPKILESSEATLRSPWSHGSNHLAWVHRLEQCVCARAEAERTRGELTCFIVQVRFTSPVKGAPVGPSETGVTEYQRYKLSSDSPASSQLLVETQAEYSGIPYADCFRVQTDFYFTLPKDGSAELNVSVRVGVRWIKSSKLLPVWWCSGVIAHYMSFVTSMVEKSNCYRR